MSDTHKNLLDLSSKFEQIAKASLVIEAKKETKKTVDPKAHVRNRGIVIFPAESPKVKDKKDHFPINDAAQARNALARCHQYDKVPSWYKGTLKSLQDAVARKVKSEYPSIDVAGKKKSKKTSGANYSMVKNAQHVRAFFDLVSKYETGADALQDFAHAVKMMADMFVKETDVDNPEQKRVAALMYKQAELIFNLVPEVGRLDEEISGVENDSFPEEQEEKV